MKELNGQFMMEGCAPHDPTRLDTPEQLLALLRTVGFLPLFANGIPGFSVEEHVPASHWWTGEASDPWEWRHMLCSNPELAYGKFFGRKAGFIHRDWFPVFANYRRNGYDFDALYDDGLAPFKWKNAMELFSLDEEAIGKELPASALSGEGVKTELQMRTYLIHTAFRQKQNKRGEPYGWHLGWLSTPESKWGYDLVASCYHEEPARSRERIRAKVLALYPSAAEKDLHALLDMPLLTHKATR